MLMPDFKSYKQVKKFFETNKVGHRAPCEWFGEFKITLYKTKAIIYTAEFQTTYYEDGRVIIKKIPKIRSPFAKKYKGKQNEKKKN